MGAPASGSFCQAGRQVAIGPGSPRAAQLAHAAAAGGPQPALGRSEGLERSLEVGRCLRSKARSESRVRVHAGALCIARACLASAFQRAKSRSVRCPVQVRAPRSRAAFSVPSCCCACCAAGCSWTCIAWALPYILQFCGSTARGLSTGSCAALLRLSRASLSSSLLFWPQRCDSHCKVCDLRAQPRSAPGQLGLPPYCCSVRRTSLPSASMWGGFSMTTVCTALPGAVVVAPCVMPEGPAPEGPAAPVQAAARLVCCREQAAEGHRC